MVHISKTIVLSNLHIRNVSNVLFYVQFRSLTLLEILNGIWLHSLPQISIVLFMNHCVHAQTNLSFTHITKNRETEIVARKGEWKTYIIIHVLLCALSHTEHCCVFYFLFFKTLSQLCTLTIFIGKDYGEKKRKINIKRRKKGERICKQHLNSKNKLLI